MPAATSRNASATPHVPVLLRPLLEAVAPVLGHWVDGTFGAGGYTRGLFEAGADRVTGIDRDPRVFSMAQPLRDTYGERLRLVEGTFSDLDRLAETLVEGVVLDLGVSSMQLDQAERGFSFLRDGPLDMRMAATGPSAADIVNMASETELADILFHYGEERASRRIARAIVASRPFMTTLELAAVVERCLPRAKPGQAHPATRSFQAIRIAVNDEFGQLALGLEAAERALKPGGQLAVVTFHSLEDRIVKRFFQLRSGNEGQGSRYAPARQIEAPAFVQKLRRAVAPDDRELAENPRSRSAKLRVGIRTEAPAGRADRGALGLPKLALEGLH
ncbi:MAG: 16S rRNA (cytosine(1402)-N(4))-methyltransferase RsmH [Rhodobacteraceae bacterium]|nr:16S rRNA (cytosine(1402)-N(4))-methyltransferase RsmH [Paracoccaceae bacterium]